MSEWLADDARLANLTLDEVNAAFRKWFSPDKTLTIAAGSFKDKDTLQTAQKD
ncbi:MAG: hypothetical protein Q4D91_11185 [Lautropia sp.]|nr:hypothetical protein [Lautropia sp.]